MFGKGRQGAAAYAQVSVDTGVLAANPHQLIVLLFEGALLATDTALVYMKNGDIAGKGRAISRAIDIVGNGLAASLDTGSGGEIAQNLAALYAYIGRQLVAANLNNDCERLKEVKILLTQLKEAWAGIADIRKPVAEAAGALA